jgi:hypothetical protein
MPELCFANGRESSYHTLAGNLSIQFSFVSSKATLESFPEMNGMDFIKWILK